MSKAEEQALELIPDKYPSGLRHLADPYTERHFFVKGYEQAIKDLKADAIERTVKVDAGGYPYIDCNIELYDYDKDIPLAQKGDKVKVVILKD